MSFTNQTQHYGLPQYVGTDVPAWLTDINTAFATIDQGMNAAKTQADSAATAAGQAVNDVSALQSTVNTQATQISAAAQAASAAQTTANTADGKADQNTQDISGLDTRVTALEQGGGGGGSLNVHRYQFSGRNVNAAAGGWYYDSAIPYADMLPQGIGEEKIVSVYTMIETTGYYVVGTAIGAQNGIRIMSNAAHTNVSGTVVITYES